MNKCHKIFLMAAVLICFLSAESRAGVHIGNGGDVVVCRQLDGYITRIELLDFYEGREIRGFNLSLGNDYLSFEDKIEHIFQKISRVDPIRVKLYRYWFSQFRSEALFKSGLILQDVPDSGHFSIPKNCQLEQIIIQKRPAFPEDRRYLVNLDLWNRLDQNNQAGLVLHELVFRELLERWNDGTGAKDIQEAKKLSRWTRYVTSYITSDKFEYLTPDEYQDLVRSEIDERNDGGSHVLLCENKSQPNVNTQLLDLYEGREFRGIEASLGPKNMALTAKVRMVFERLAKVDPDRSKLYQEWTAEFLNQILFQQSTEMVNFPVERLLAIPERCRVEQIAIQKTSRLPSNKRYIVNHDLWVKLDADSQTALIFHELIVRESLAFKEPKRIEARYFNSYLLSDKFETLSDEDYNSLLIRVGLK